MPAHDRRSPAPVTGVTTPLRGATVAVALAPSKPSRPMLAAELPAGDGHRHRRRAQRSPRRSGANTRRLSEPRLSTKTMTQSPIASAIADAIAELEAYDDEEHRAVLALVRQILDQDEDA